MKRMNVFFSPLKSKLLKNAHLLRFPYPSSLRRTFMYASFLGISGALHLGIFEQLEKFTFSATRKTRIILPEGNFPVYKGHFNLDFSNSIRGNGAGIF